MPQVKLIHLPDGTKNVVSSFVIASPPGVVWNVLTDYSSFTRFMPGIKKFCILQSESTKKIVDIKLDLSFFSDPFIYKADLKEDVSTKTITMTRINGDFNYLKATYKLKLEANGTKTLISYSLLINHEKDVPDVFVDNVLKRNTTKTLKAIEKESLNRNNKKAKS